MKYKVRRDNIEEIHKLLGKGGLHATESNKFLNRKDRKDTKQILNQIDHMQDIKESEELEIEDGENDET